MECLRKPLAPGLMVLLWGTWKGPRVQDTPSSVMSESLEVDGGPGFFKKHIYSLSHGLSYTRPRGEHLIGTSASAW